MASLGISPTIPSLLIPPNPSFSSPESAPRGGILLNPRRESDASTKLPSSPAFIATSIGASSPGPRRASEPPDSPRTPISPIEPISPQVGAQPNVPLASPSGQPRIRFAPLPDPRRPRSLSTGRNVELKATEGPDGETTRTIEIRGVVPTVEYDDDDDVAVDEAEGESDEGWSDSRGRRWSKSMTMGMNVGSMNSVPGWRGTKKLFGLKEDKKDKEEAYLEGAPLKKSVSTTGGFIGSSPFRMSMETDRKRSMQGPAPANLTTRVETSHRRNSSLEPTTGAALGTSLGSSPQPVRMLNGRVYGSRRASEAAARQQEYQAKLEPDFVEWGNGKQGGLGSNTQKTSRGGFLADDDDGSGMEWVKRRREERLKKQQAEKEAAEANGTSPGGVVFNEPNLGGISPAASMASNSPETSGSVVTPATTAAPLPTTPIIQVSEYPSPSANRALDVGGPLDASTSTAGKSPEPEPAHITQAISMPQRSTEGRDVFDDTAVSDEEEEDREEEEEEEDDGDFDDDDEEEDEGPRTTSSAAGVEVVSRHKNT